MKRIVVWIREIYRSVDTRNFKVKLTVTRPEITRINTVSIPEGFTDDWETGRDRIKNSAETATF